VSGRLPVDEPPTPEPTVTEPTVTGAVDTQVVAPEVIGVDREAEPAERESPKVSPTPEPRTEAEPEPARPWVPLGERLAPAGRLLTRLRPRTVLGPIVMILVAAVLTAAGFLFRGQAGLVLDGGSAANTALSDTGATTDVVTQVTRDMETVSSYKYTDLAGAQKAGQAVSTGGFLDDYNKLFEQVKAQAPAQKAVVTGQVVKIGVRQLQGDNAELLVFLTQTTTRADTNQSNAVGLVYTVDATRSGGKWLISKLTPR
jgi:Mce-associated membrane protein